MSVEHFDLTYFVGHCHSCEMSAADCVAQCKEHGLHITIADVETMYHDIDVQYEIFLEDLARNNAEHEAYIKTLCDERSASEQGMD